MKLEKEVLSQPAFLTGITNDFVLVFIDLPENKKLLSQHARTANKGLVEKYHIEGFPTVLILDGDGRTIGMTGYKRGGPKAYVKHLMEFRKNKVAEIIENQ